MPKKNENKTDSIQMLQEESDRIRQLVIKTQTESMILDLKKSVLCFGLYLPPEELLCRNFSVLSMDDVVPDFDNASPFARTRMREGLVPQ
jgi:hypothetical protein